MPTNAAGPSVVALGGGHGLAASLRAARTYASKITGIVSIGDDGGSSGRLRAEFGVAPPGDLRRCLAALATDDSLLARSLEHRFDQGSLVGHPIGNLLLIGLTLASGSLQDAADEVGRLIGADGRVFPASTAPVTLIADSDAGTLAGEVTIERATGIRNLRFDPVDPSSPPEAVAAINAADQIVIGPGSLFTSVLATVVMPEILSALQSTPAQRVFVANVANDKGDKRGFGLAEHIDTLIDHGVDIDVVLAPAGESGESGVSAISDQGARRPPTIIAEVAADDGWSHDPAKLGGVLAELDGLVSGEIP